MIAIIDYGMGNLRSVQKGFEKVGYEAVVTADPRVVLEADKVVLPGVGAFRDCISEGWAPLASQALAFSASTLNSIGSVRGL